MNLFAFFLLFLVAMIFVAALPLISGIATYKYEKTSAKGLAKNKRNEDSNQSKREKLKERINITKDSNPMKLHLKEDGSSSSTDKFEIDGKTGLKRRVIGKYSNDPNDFDYDVDELIAEEEIENQREEDQRYERFAGKESEAREELV